MSLYVLCIILLSVTWLPCASSGNFANCSTKLSVLEKALFSTGQNQFNLSKEFYPPRKQPSRYIKVIYMFQNEDGYPDNECTVGYYWAIEGSLLIQPPTIFQFTSLMLSTPHNDIIKNVFLELPYECRGLVEDTTNGTCSCENHDKNPLDILTYQLKQYSKFTDPSQVIRDDTSAKAICAKELEQRYLEHTGVILYFAVTLLLPIILMIGMAVITRYTHEAIIEKLSQPYNHPNLAGFMLTGIWLILYVTILDLAALIYIYRSNKYEYKGDNSLTKTFPIAGILIATFILNLYFLCVYVIFCLLYLCGSCKECMKYSIIIICLHHIYVIYGSKTRNYLELSGKKPFFWALISMVTLLFSFASHAGYIMVAWLTEPAKTTAISLLAIGICIILFLTFRQCYVINKEPIPYCLSCDCLCLCRSLCQDYWCSCCDCCKKNVNNGGSINDEDKPINTTSTVNYGNNGTKKDDDTENNNDSFSIKSCFFTSVFSIAIVGCVSFILAAFYKVPFSTFQLPLYFENIAQIVIVVLSFLVTYKILTINDKDIQKFIKSLRKHTKTVKDIPDITNDFEAAGELAAVVIDKVYKMKDH